MKLLGRSAQETPQRPLTESDQAAINMDKMQDGLHQEFKRRLELRVKLERVFELLEEFHGPNVIAVRRVVRTKDNATHTWQEIQTDKSLFYPERDENASTPPASSSD